MKAKAYQLHVLGFTVRSVHQVAVIVRHAHDVLDGRGLGVLDCLVPHHPRAVIESLGVTREHKVAVVEQRQRQTKSPPDNRWTTFRQSINHLQIRSATVPLLAEFQVLNCTGQI